MTDFTQPPVAAPPPGRRPQRPRIAISFGGQAGEFFGIWIVNILLTLITLGIYWPWAYVRTKRYFLESTQIEGSSFIYHATGGMIFKGWIIVIAVLIAVNITGVFVPWAPLIFWLAVLPAIPWLINRSLAFQARMISWRGVHFRFEGDYLPALIAFLIAPIGAMLTLGLLFPLAAGLQARYVVNNYRFGTAPFSLNLGIGAFYRVALWLILVNLLVVVVAGVIGYTAFLAAADESDPLKQTMLGATIGSIVIAVTIFFISLTGLFYKVMIRNLIVGEMALDPRHRFQSNLSVIEYPLKVVFGWMLVMFTFGLMFPWYKCMLWRTQCEALVIRPSCPIDGFVDTLITAQPPGAFGDQAADALGIEIGI